MRTVLVVLAVLLLAGCTISRKDTIFHSGSINQWGGMPGSFEPIVDAETGEVTGFMPLPLTVPSPEMAAAPEDPKTAQGARDAVAGGSGSPHCINILIGQNDGVAQDTTTDAQVDADVSVVPK